MTAQGLTLTIRLDKRSVVGPVGNLYEVREAGRRAVCRVARTWNGIHVRGREGGTLGSQSQGPDMAGAGMGLSRATGSSWPSSTRPWAAAGRSWGDRGRCIRAEYGPARLQGLKAILPPGSQVGLGAAQPFCTPVSLREKWGGTGPAASSGERVYLGSRPR